MAFLQQFLLRAEELKQQNAVTPAQLAEWYVPSRRSCLFCVF